MKLLREEQGISIRHLAKRAGISKSSLSKIERGDQIAGLEASERIAEEIIANLTAGLLVVNDGGSVQIVNPVGRRLLGIDEGPHAGRAYRDGS